AARSYLAVGCGGLDGRRILSLRAVCPEFRLAGIGLRRRQRAGSGRLRLLVRLLRPELCAGCLQRPAFAPRHPSGEAPSGGRADSPLAPDPLDTPPGAAALPP